MRPQGHDQTLYGACPEHHTIRGGTLTRQARAQSVVSLLTIIVIIDYADRNALGAVAPDVKTGLHISTQQLGYLGASFGLVGGLATLGAGVLIDRVPRLRLLATTALLWSIAMVATGAAQSLLWLLIARSALAVVLASVGPAYPSLIADAVPPERRTRALGIVDSGQLIGGAAGVVLGAIAVAFLSWRWVFLFLALPALWLVVRLWNEPEPVRRSAPKDAALPMRTVASQLWRTQTAVRVLVAAAIGSYYLSGASSFATVFAVAHYNVSTAAADGALLALGFGAMGGLWLGSRDGDRLVAQGRGAARLTRTAQLYTLTAAFWIPSLFVGSIFSALPFLILGSACLAATIPVLDAIRVDVLPAGILGRSEAVRTLARSLAEGGAPFVFGMIVGGVGSDDRGLQIAFLTAMPALVVASLLLLWARHTYDGDVRRQQVIDLTDSEAHEQPVKDRPRRAAGAGLIMEEKPA